MADKTVFGGPPPANVTGFPPGSMWVQIVQMAADTTGKTFKASVWSQQLTSQIAWGDGTFNNPVAWTAAPAADKQLGRVDVQHAYTGRGGTLYRMMFEAGGVRQWAQVESGEPIVVDDVSRDGVERPPKDDQTAIFAERGRMAVSIRKQMRQQAAATKPEGGRVN
jgi:hypothetical protein